MGSTTRSKGVRHAVQTRLGKKSRSHSYDACSGGLRRPPDLECSDGACAICYVRIAGCIHIDDVVGSRHIGHNNDSCHDAIAHDRGDDDNDNDASDCSAYDRHRRGPGCIRRL